VVEEFVSPTIRVNAIVGILEHNALSLDVLASYKEEPPLAVATEYAPGLISVIVLVDTLVKNVMVKFHLSCNIYHIILPVGALWR